MTKEVSFDFLHLYRPDVLRDTQTELHGTPHESIKQLVDALRSRGIEVRVVHSGTSLQRGAAQRWLERYELTDVDVPSEQVDQTVFPFSTFQSINHLDRMIEKTVRDRIVVRFDAMRLDGSLFVRSFDDQMESEKTICVDFDGVLHWYRRGFRGRGVVDDAPVPGAATFVRDLITRGYTVVVCSSRLSSTESHDAVASWLKTNGFPVDSPNFCCSNVKPPAVLYVDDRAYRFKGDFGAVLSMLDKQTALKPWVFSCPARREIGEPKHEGIVPMRTGGLVRDAKPNDDVRVSLNIAKHGGLRRPEIAAERIEQVARDLGAFLMEKNSAYGNSVFDPVRVLSSASPEEAIRVRIDDKLSRLMRGDPSARERVSEDTILDLAGYLVLLLVERGWKLPPITTGDGKIVLRIP